MNINSKKFGILKNINDINLYLNSELNSSSISYIILLFLSVSFFRLNFEIEYLENGNKIFEFHTQIILQNFFPKISFLGFKILVLTMNIGSIFHFRGVNLLKNGSIN